MGDHGSMMEYVVPNIRSMAQQCSTVAWRFGPTMDRPWTGQLRYRLQALEGSDQQSGCLLVTNVRKNSTHRHLCSAGKGVGKPPFWAVPPKEVEKTPISRWPT